MYSSKKLAVIGAALTTSFCLFSGCGNENTSETDLKINSDSTLHDSAKPTIHTHYETQGSRSVKYTTENQNYNYEGLFQLTDTDNNIYVSLHGYVTPGDAEIAYKHFFETGEVTLPEASSISHISISIDGRKASFDGGTMEGYAHPSRRSNSSWISAGPEFSQHSREGSGFYFCEA